MLSILVFYVQKFSSCFIIFMFVFDQKESFFIPHYVRGVFSHGKYQIIHSNCKKMHIRPLIVTVRKCTYCKMHRDIAIARIRL